MINGEILFIQKEIKEDVQKENWSNFILTFQMSVVLSLISFIEYFKDKVKQFAWFNA